jgi:replication factor C subunit 1
MLTDKYKPQILENVVGNKISIDNIQKWFENWASEKNSKKDKNICALLSGTSGIGKTLCVDLFIKKYDLNPIELNPDDKIDKEYIMKTILPSLQVTKSFSKKKNIFIIHDIDCYDDYGFISSIVSCLKKTKIPVIATCNNRYDQSLKPIIPYCLDFKFQKPSMNDIIQFLKPIIKLENIKTSETRVKQLIEDCDCDIRSSLNNLQFYNSKTTNSSCGNKDKTNSNIFEITKLFISQNIETNEKQTLFWLSHDLLPLMLHENYPYNNIKMKNDVTYLNNIASSASSLSDLDIFEKEIHTNGTWELLPYTAWLSVKAVENCHTKGQIKFTSFFEKRAVKKQTLNKNIVKDKNENKDKTIVKSKNSKKTSEKIVKTTKTTRDKKNKDESIKSQEKPKVVKKKNVKQLVIEE